MKFNLRTLLVAFVVFATVIALNADRLSEFFEPKESGIMMSQRNFWRIIDQSWQGATDNQQFRDNLTQQLNQLSEDNLQRFNSRYSERYWRAYDHRLWCAIYLINGGCGDDSFMDFRDYLISRGSKVYNRTINDPETLLDDPLERIG